MLHQMTLKLFAWMLMLVWISPACTTDPIETDEQNIDNLSHYNGGVDETAAIEQELTELEQARPSFHHSELEDLVSPEFNFAFTMPKDFTIRALDSSHLSKTEPVYRWSVEYIWLGLEKNQSFYSQEPQMIIALYPLDNVTDSWPGLPELAAPEKPPTVKIGRYEFYRSIMPGLVPDISYCVVEGDRLFQFVVKAYPAHVFSKELQEKINQGFMLILQTLELT
jgi:hypothetical protein